MINKASREGVHVYKVELNKKHLSAYYRLYFETMLRLNRLPLPTKAFYILSHVFGEKVELYLAEYNGKSVGGIVAFIYNKRMHIWSNASDKNFTSLGVNNALYGFAIQRACELKLHEVDFGSSLINSSHHFFKKRFGGVEMPIYCNHEIDPDVRPGLLLKIATPIMKILPIPLVSFLSRVAHKTSFRSIFKLACGIFLPLFLLFLISPLFILNSGKKQIYTDINSIPNYEVAIVFGAGIKDDGTPSDALKDRLRTAAELYDAGKVEKILVSGDNSFESYDEPTAMYTYLVDTEGIPAEDVFIDYAGRCTYDTCIRAHEIWGVDEAILVSQGFHLPRAIFTCNSVGVDSSGYSATNQGYVFADYYKFREVLAIYNAVIDVYLWEPEYMKGDFEQDLQIY
ncbi:MAG: GNAT family N-acetyltransferase [Candidatus Gracilibacteria bacterium]